MQTQSSDENSVRPSVKRVHCDKREERYVQIFYTVRKIILPDFGEEEWLVGATSSTWNFGSTGPGWSEIADFEPIFARSASAITSIEKSSINQGSYGQGKSGNFEWVREKSGNFKIPLTRPIIYALFSQFLPASGGAPRPPPGLRPKHCRLVYIAIFYNETKSIVLHLCT